MQAQGVVRHLGLSTHTPEMANRVLDMELIDVMMFSINPMYDYGQGDVLARDHYLTLSKTAKDCVHCGHCNSRCPFKVDQMNRMSEIKAYFGK